MTQDIIIRILSAAVLLGLAVFVHEAGHFLMAKKKGVRVEKFSLGFGPKIAGFKRGGTEYMLSLIPLGGYVKMAGDDPLKKEGAPGEFFTKTPASRIKIVLAGPCMNLILAYLLTVIVLAAGLRVPEYPNVIGEPPGTLRERGFLPGDRILELNGTATRSWSDISAALAGRAEERLSVKIERDGGHFLLEGIPAGELAGLTPFIPPELGEVVPGTPAYAAGLKPGDSIIGINGEPVRDWAGMQSIVSRSAGAGLRFEIERNGESLSFNITPVDIMGDGSAVIGVSAAAPEFTVEKFGLASFPYALISNLRQIGMSYRMLWLIITRPGQYKQFLGGPVMVVQMAGDEAVKGFSDFLSFMAAINIMLAIVNLIPFPVLDGGHILFFAIENFRGRPLPVRVQDAAQRFALVLLVMLMAYLIAQDSLRQLERARVLRSNSENSREAQ